MRFNFLDLRASFCIKDDKVVAATKGQSPPIDRQRHCSGIELDLILAGVEVDLVHDGIVEDTVDHLGLVEHSPLQVCPSERALIENATRKVGLGYVDVVKVYVGEHKAHFAEQGDRVGAGLGSVPELLRPNYHF